MPAGRGSPTAPPRITSAAKWAGLLTAFATAGYELLAESVLTEVGQSRPADAPGELAAIGRGYVSFAIAHPSHFEVMFRAGGES